MDHGDAQLVRASLVGHHAAFGTLVDRYRDAVFGMAYHMVGDFTVAEDLAQDAFVQAFAKLPQLRAPGRFAPWLLAITRNVCRQHVRAQHAAQSHTAAESSEHDPTEGLQWGDIVHRALASIPSENGLAVTLFHVDGYSYAELASFLRVPLSTIKGRIQRGRDQLRREMVAIMDEQLDRNKPGDELTEAVLRRICAADVWQMDGDAQGEQLRQLYLLIDGDLAQMRISHGVGGTHVSARTGVYAAGDEPISVYESVGHAGRYYVFGPARVLPDGPEVADQMIQAEIRVTALGAADGSIEPWRPPEVCSADVWAMAPKQRDEFFSSLPANSILMLDGGIARACLTAGGPGCSTGSPDGAVSIANDGEDLLYVYRWEWPRTRYFIFGKARVTPPGFAVEDSTIVLHACLETSADKT